MDVYSGKGYTPYHCAPPLIPLCPIPSYHCAPPLIPLCPSPHTTVPLPSYHCAPPLIPLCPSLHTIVPLPSTIVPLPSYHCAPPLIPSCPSHHTIVSFAGWEYGTHTMVHSGLHQKEPITLPAGGSGLEPEPLSQMLLPRRSRRYEIISL